MFRIYIYAVCQVPVAEFHLLQVKHFILSSFYVQFVKNVRQMLMIVYVLSGVKRLLVLFCTKDRKDTHSNTVN